MRVLALAIVLALGGCEKDDSFLVDDPHNLVRSATLFVCSSATPMHRVGSAVKVTRAITCENQGYIRLIYRDGTREYCGVGYVTPGAEQDWRFRAEPTSCTPGENPEAALRHCVVEQARSVAQARQPTYDDAVAFVTNCNDFAREAAVLWTRKDLGRNFDPESPETVRQYRENLRTIIEAHVCAIGFDPNHCEPL